MSVPIARTPRGKVIAKTESKTLVAANSGRKLLIVTVKGASDVYLALGPSAAKEEGITLRKEGGAIAIPGTGPEGYSGEVTCYAHEGEPLVTFAEV